jgi:type IV secretory pathway VirB2 component (pilin)
VIQINSTRVILVVVALALVFQAGPVRAEGGASEAGLGATSALTSLVYGPVKIVYAVLGVVFGGFAYGLSGGDSNVMRAVATPAIRGDYVITPTHLRGERPIEFFGQDPGYRGDDAVLEDLY